MIRHGMKRAVAGNVGGGGGDANLVFHDTFTDADSTLFSTHAPEVGVWVTGYPAGLFIRDNRVTGAGLAGSLQVSVNSGLQYEMILRGARQDAVNHAFTNGLVDGYRGATTWMGKNSVFFAYGRYDYDIYETVNGTRYSRAEATSSYWVPGSFFNGVYKDLLVLQVKFVGTVFYARGSMDGGVTWGPELSYDLGYVPVMADPRTHSYCNYGEYQYTEFAVADNPTHEDWLL